MKSWRRGYGIISTGNNIAVICVPGRQDAGALYRRASAPAVWLSGYNRSTKGLNEMASKAIFAAYKGDRFIAEGTSRELAKALGVKIETIYFYRSPAYARRGSGKNRMVVIRVED
jgi:hypothetical protein